VTLHEWPGSKELWRRSDGLAGLQHALEQQYGHAHAEVGVGKIENRPVEFLRHSPLDEIDHSPVGIKKAIEEMKTEGSDKDKKPYDPFYWPLKPSGPIQ